ncbi:MAG: hypothetical protein V4515_00260 [Chloroflexota bacterium]
MGGDARPAADDRQLDRREFVAVVGAAVALTVLAAVAPASAIVIGPALLLAGLLGLRRAKAGPRLHLVLVVALGAMLTFAVFVATLFLVRIR